MASTPAIRALAIIQGWEAAKNGQECVSPYFNPSLTALWYKGYDSYADR